MSAQPTTPNLAVAPALVAQTSTGVRRPTPPPLPAAEVPLLADSDVLDAHEDAEVKPVTFSQPELNVALRPRRLVLLSAVLVAVGAVGWFGIHGSRDHRGPEPTSHGSAASVALPASIPAPHIDTGSEDANAPDALAAKATSKKKPTAHPKASAKRPAANAASLKKKPSAPSSSKPRKGSH